MGLFKRKSKIDSKFKKNDFVSFNTDKDLKVGIISDIRIENDKIVYDIKVGGECPSLAKSVEENKIFKN